MKIWVRIPPIYIHIGLAENIAMLLYKVKQRSCSMCFTPSDGVMYVEQKSNVQSSLEHMSRDQALLCVEQKSIEQ
jgi:hypothetical protein